MSLHSYHTRFLKGRHFLIIPNSTIDFYLSLCL